MIIARCKGCLRDEVLVNPHYVPLGWTRVTHDERVTSIEQGAAEVLVCSIECLKVYATELARKLKERA